MDGDEYVMITPDLIPIPSKSDRFPIDDGHHSVGQINKVCLTEKCGGTQRISDEEGCQRDPGGAYEVSSIHQFSRIPERREGLRGTNA